MVCFIAIYCVLTDIAKAAGDEYALSLKVHFRESPESFLHPSQAVAAAKHNWNRSTPSHP